MRFAFTIYTMSESSIFTRFQTILRSKLNSKTRLHISLVLNILGVISVKSPQCPLHVTRPEAPTKCYLASTAVVCCTLLILHGSSDLHTFTQSPQWWSTTSYLGSTVTAYYTLFSLQRSNVHILVNTSLQ